MTNEEKESVIERRVNKEIRKIKAYSYVWINVENIEVCIFSKFSNYLLWRKNDYDKSLLDGSDEEIAMQILLDFTFNTWR